MTTPLWGRIAAAAALLFLIVTPQGLKPYGLLLLSQWAVFSIAAVGLNLTLGYAGQVSLAQAAFLGVGAYTAALMTTHGWPLWSALLAAGALGFAIGWVLGYPALRVQHHYLAFVTLAFTTLAFLVFRNETWLTGGVYGINRIPRPTLLGWPTARDPLLFYYFCLAMLLLVLAGMWRLTRSPWGRAFIALRENPIRASSLGVDTRAYTLLAFAIGAGLGALAGALYAALVQYIDPSSFTLAESLKFLLMVVVGGSGYFLGPLVGSAISVLLPEWLRFTEGWYLILYAVLVMVLMAWCPSGLLGLLDRLVRRAQRLSHAAPAAPLLGKEPGA
ncbi:MAG TPA: branched-chain amino acid ABC transporter permease [Stellaceae bacterium]|nr:branched-chain amino acid ABC transporter permease [Stellaceae bacterium]